MNVDIKIKASPSVARKLLTLQSLSGFDVSQDIVELAGEDLVTDDLIFQRVPSELREMANVNLVDIVQHAVDWNHRFPLPTIQGVDATILALSCAFYSNKKALVISPEDLDLNMMRMKMKFCSTKMLGKDDGNSEHDILFTKMENMNDDLINHTRDRVLIMSCTPAATRSHYMNPGSWLLDYPHVIAAMTVKPKKSLLADMDVNTIDVNASAALNSAMMWYHPTVWVNDRNGSSKKIDVAARQLGAFTKFTYESHS